MGALLLRQVHAAGPRTAGCAFGAPLRVATARRLLTLPRLLLGLTLLLRLAVTLGLGLALALAALALRP
jgi:hypothetical protein